jgi:hypothetical protein
LTIGHPALLSGDGYIDSEHLVLSTVRFADLHSFSSVTLLVLGGLRDQPTHVPINDTRLACVSIGSASTLSSTNSRLSMGHGKGRGGSAKPGSVIILDLASA